MKRSVMLVLLLATCTLAQSRVSVKRVEYNGWKDALIMSNGKVEAVIVPSIGRVMQFRYVGEGGVFWENPAVAGSPVNPDSKEWINFGGDKPWPAPQADWPKVTPRGWPPPVGFDSSVWEAKIVPCERNKGGTFKGLYGCSEYVNRPDFHSLTLLSPIDPQYGIRVRRNIILLPSHHDLTITTVFEKVSSNPVKVGVWVISQLSEAAAVFIPIPKKTQYPDGYNKQSKELPEHFKVANGLIELKRDPKKSTKIGNDASSLLWVGKKHMLKIDSLRVPNAEYPDNGSSAEVYTNPDPLKYIELEMLGPLQEMKVGDKISRTNVYTLMRRSKRSPEEEARNIFSSNKPAQ